MTLSNNTIDIIDDSTGDTISSLPLLIHYYTIAEHGTARLAYSYQIDGIDQPTPTLASQEAWQHLATTMAIDYITTQPTA